MVRVGVDAEMEGESWGGWGGARGGCGNVRQGGDGVVQLCEDSIEKDIAHCSFSAGDRLVIDERLFNVEDGVERMSRCHPHEIT